MEDNNISITLSDCNINAKEIGSASQYVFAELRDDDAQVCVSGCKYIINGNSVVNGKIIIQDYTGNITINGGTFSVDPSEYVGEGHIIKQQGNNNWIVK